MYKTSNQGWLEAVLVFFKCTIYFHCWFRTTGMQRHQMSICIGYRSMLKRLSGAVSRLVSPFSFMDRFAYRNSNNMFTANKRSLFPRRFTRRNFFFWHKNVALLSNLKYFIRKLNNAAASLCVSEQVCLAFLQTQCRQITYGNRITPGKYVDQGISVGIAAKRRG